MQSVSVDQIEHNLLYLTSDVRGHRRRRLGVDVSILGHEA